jgi:IclR family transcriptional regulator, acetate operon repressor
MEEGDLRNLRRELGQIRRNGFAINNQRTESGLTALGMAVQVSDGRVVGGISLALPSVRFRKERVPGWVRDLHECATGIAGDLEADTAPAAANL